MDDHKSDQEKRKKKSVAVCRISIAQYPMRPPFDPSESYAESSGDAIDRNEKNEVYRAVRDTLAVLGMDELNLGTSRWNPMRDLVREGGTIVIKPNLVSEPRTPLVPPDCITTHGSVIRPLIDYGLKAVGDRGEVIVADAPQFDSDFDRIVRANGLSETIRVLSERHGRQIQLLDLRAECAKVEDGVVTKKVQLKGDPKGYTQIDLGEMSMLRELELQASRFRGSDYDRSVTITHHTNGKHQYSISNTVLTSDCIISVPKLKTHEKTGVTLNLKNFIGINGHKNLIPHYRIGSVDSGGDEMSTNSPRTQFLSAAYEAAQSILPRAGPLGTRLMKILKLMDSSIVSSNPGFQRAGAWWGNDTLWRGIHDLAVIAHLAGEGGEIPANRARSIFSIVDGIVAGEGNGPLSPKARNEGVIIGGHDLVAVDLVAISLMGHNPNIFRSYSRLSESPLSRICTTDDNSIRVLSPGMSPWSVSQIRNNVLRPFELSDGWKDATESMNPGRQA